METIGYSLFFELVRLNLQSQISVTTEYLDIFLRDNEYVIEDGFYSITTKQQQLQVSIGVIVEDCVCNVANFLCMIFGER